MISPVGDRPVARGRFSSSLIADPQARLLFLRFGVVGLVNTAFGYAVFALLVLAGAWPGAALVASTVAGVAFNFQTSRRLVFRSGAGGRGLRFAALYGGVLFVNWVALRALHGLNLSDLQAQAILVFPIAILSFAGQKLFVFGAAAP
jgi:putative flippase GtrA